MKNLLTVALVSVGSLTISSCSKDKRADFDLDKASYVQGETIKTTNTTVKGSKFYRWTFGEAEFYEKEPTFVIDKYQTPGQFIITCEATNNKNTTNNSKSSSKTVMIEEARLGKIVFWNSGSGPVEIAIKLYNNSMPGRYDTITFSNSTNPLCNGSSNNAFYTNLRSGTYSFTAQSQITWESESGTIELKDGYDCQSVQIF